MGKRKKSSNELDAILEQLKRSYGADIDAELEDSLLDDDRSDEDDELSSVLAKIFSDFDEDTNRSDVSEAQTTDIAAEVSIDDKIDATPAKQAETEGSAPESHAMDAEGIDTVNDEDAIAESPDRIPTQEKEVESVLDAMLHKNQSHRASVAKREEDSKEQPSENLIEELLTKGGAEDNATDLTVEAEAEKDLILNEIPTMEELSLAEDALDQETVDEDSSASQDNSDNLSIEDIDLSLVDEQNKTESEQEAVDISDSDPCPLAEFEASIEREICEMLDTEHESDPTVLVLDPEDYSFDPLQMSLDDLEIMKIEEDVEETQAQSAVDEPIISHADNNVLDSNDVSLLVKFGYGEEVNAQIGRSVAKKVIFDKESKYSPERHKIPYGFIGKEYSSRSEDETIRRKYKNDRFVLLISLIVLSAFATMSLIFGLIFEFSPDKVDNYGAIMLLDFLLVSLSLLICGKKIASGAICIGKFESNPYSVLLILAAEYLTYNVIVSMIYAFEPILLYNSFCWISGFCILAYFAVIALCDFFTCDKEYKTFELMTSQPSFHTAEILHPSDELGESSRAKGHVNATPGTYRVRKTPIISGYFKRISESGAKSISPVYVLGIVPSISLALGCGVAIVSESFVFGIHTFTITSVLCLPLSCLCIGAISGIINANRYRKNSAAFIGDDNANDYSSVATLVFDDTEAMEITSYKEINPGKAGSDTNEKLAIAYNVFKALRGPLGEAVPEKYLSSEGHELIINSISDNGINVYFDASTNILIGDKQYMLEHNLKVKTDVSLTTATRGADRYVIYMAFDGKPQLGFVLTQKIKPDFARAVAILSDSGINIEIESYEPEVNDVYFDQNKTSDYSVITVHKPSRYQEKTNDASCDGAIIAKDALSLSKAISNAKGEPARKKRIKRTNLISFLIGGVLAVLIALILCLDTPIALFDALREHPFIALYVALILTTIPATINVIKEYIKK